MNPTVIAVLSAAAVALLVAGVGLYLISRSRREDDDPEVVSSAGRLAEVRVSPFGANDELPEQDEIPEQHEHLAVTEVIPAEAPVWAGATATDAMFPSPPPVPEPVTATESDPVPEPEPPKAPDSGWEYDPDAVLAELRGEPPIGATVPKPEPEPEPELEAEPEPVAEAGPAGPLDPPIWAPPGANGHPPKVLHRSTLPPVLAAGVETEWFLLTPIEALGEWPSSIAPPAAPPQPEPPQPEPPQPEPARAEPQSAPVEQQVVATVAPVAPIAPVVPPVVGMPPLPPPPPPPPGGSVQLPDSLLADLLGGTPPEDTAEGS